MSIKRQQNKVNKGLTTSFVVLYCKSKISQGEDVNDTETAGTVKDDESWDIPQDKSKSYPLGGAIGKVRAFTKVAEINFIGDLMDQQNKFLFTTILIRHHKHNSLHMYAFGSWNFG